MRSVKRILGILMAVIALNGGCAAPEHVSDTPVKSAPERQLFYYEVQLNCCVDLSRGTPAKVPVCEKSIAEADAWLKRALPGHHIVRTGNFWTPPQRAGQVVFYHDVEACRPITNIDDVAYYTNLFISRQDCPQSLLRTPIIID